ncbi:hypothetical protein DFJ77DRAFT_474618 [Powellomyces hirtus]|nr:hypothetical protein DFJ77DRAFT_474618 [Powellomyces hirtus]
MPLVFTSTNTNSFPAPVSIYTPSIVARKYNYNTCQQYPTYPLPPIKPQAARSLGGCGGAYSQKHREIQRTERLKNQAAAMKVQQSVLRLAKETEDRQRNEASKRLRQQQRELAAREKILLMRRTHQQSALPPWRLGAYSKPGSAGIRPLITGQQRPSSARHLPSTFECADDAQMRHLLYLDTSASDPRFVGSLSARTRHKGGGARVGVRSAPPALGRRRDARREEVLRILEERPRTPSSGRSHLSYIASHNGRDVRVVKGYAVEIRDVNEDGVVETFSTPTVPAFPTLASRTPPTAPSATNPYHHPPPESNSNTNNAGPKKAIILDLTPVDGSDDTIDGSDADPDKEPVTHGPYAREKWVQSSRTQNTGSMRIVRPGSAAGAASSPSGSRPSSSKKERKADEDGDTRVFVRKDADEDRVGGGEEGGKVQKEKQQQQQEEKHLTRPSSGRTPRMSILSSRPSSAARPASGRNITFAKNDQVIWDCDHRPRVGAGSEENSEIEQSTGGDGGKTRGGGAETTQPGTTTGAGSTQHPSPSAPSPTRPPTARSPLSAPPRRINPSVLPTHFFSALASDPRTAIPPSIREMLRKDALASQFLDLTDKARVRSAPPVRKEVSVGGKSASVPAAVLAAGHPSRLPRWKSSLDNRRAAIQAKVQIPKENILKAWKIRDQKATTEICLYAQSAPRLPQPSAPASRTRPHEGGRIQVHQIQHHTPVQAADTSIWGNSSTSSHNNIAHGIHDDAREQVFAHQTSDTIYKQKNAAENGAVDAMATKESELLQSIEHLDRLLSPKLKRLSFADVTAAV